MKITFLTLVAAQNGGCRVVAIYAKKLLEAGHDVHIVSRRPQPQSLPKKVMSRARGRNIQTFDKDHTLFFDEIGDRHILLPWQVPLNPDDIPDADVIIATQWRTAFEASAMPESKGKKAYFVQHHEVHEHLPWDLSRGTYFLPLKKITIADWLVETMAREYGDTDVVKVENSVDTEQFTAPPRARNAVPTVGFLYSTTPFKGVDISLKAIEIARQKFPDLRVMAFGAKDPSPDLPLPDNSEFHRSPPQDKLRELYARCDVWLCGSRAEGFHLPPSEAMACRCPVVSTRVGGTVEIITEGQNGHLVEVDDFKGLGAGLVSVLERSPEEWRKMSDAAHARVNSYTWDDATRAFEAALAEVVGA